MGIYKLIKDHLNRKYKLWVINTTSESKLYLWDNWKLLFPLINQLVLLSPSKAFIRTNQSLEHKSGFLGFGRMAWNKENNEKWTKKYRENEYANKKVTFYDTQICAPDWNQHCDSSIPPDIFIKVYNYKNDINIKEGIIIAMPERTYNKDAKEIEAVLKDILKIIPESTLSHTSRHWNPSRGYPNQIQDINNWEIAKVINDV